MLMDFVLRGRDYKIDKTSIIKAVSGAYPKSTDRRSKYCVEISGKHYPIKQPVHLVTGLPYIAFTAMDAYRILEKTGFAIHNIEDHKNKQPDKVKESNTLKFAVTLEKDEDGYYVASCPALPGCHSQGHTKEEAIANVSEAIRGYVASLRKHGEPVPCITEVQEVEVAA
jgi:antitoxin HicB